MFDYSRKPVKWQVGNFSHSIHICIPKSGHVYIYDTSDRRFFMETSTFFILDEKIGNNIGDGTCMNLITATRLPLNSRGSEDLRTRCCKNHPTLNGLPINIDGAHFQRACLLSLHSPQVVDLRLLSVDAFSVMCQLQYHYQKNKRCNIELHRLFVITWHSLPNSSSVPPHILRRLSGPWAYYGRGCRASCP